MKLDKKKTKYIYYIIYNDNTIFGFRSFSSLLISRNFFLVYFCSYIW